MNRNRIMKDTNQKGNSLIEVLGVLSILAMATVGIYTGISNVYGRFRMTSGVQDTKNIIKAMRDYFSSSQPASISTEKLMELGIFDSYYDDAKQYASNFLGLKTEIKISGQYSSDFAPAGSEKTFRLYTYDVPMRTCVELLDADWGGNESSGLAEIGVNTKKFRWPKDSGGDYSLPPDLNDVTVACDQNGDVTIYWEYFF